MLRGRDLLLVRILLRVINGSALLFIQIWAQRIPALPLNEQPMGIIIWVQEKSIIWGMRLLQLEPISFILVFLQLLKVLLVAFYQ